MLIAQDFGNLSNLTELHDFGIFDSLLELPKCLPELPDLPKMTRSWIILLIKDKMK